MDNWQIGDIVSTFSSKNKANFLAEVIEFLDDQNLDTKSDRVKLRFLGFDNGMNCGRGKLRVSSQAAFEKHWNFHKNV